MTLPIRDLCSPSFATRGSSLIVCNDMGQIKKSSQTTKDKPLVANEGEHSLCVSSSVKIWQQSQASMERSM